MTVSAETPERRWFVYNLTKPTKPVFTSHITQGYLEPNRQNLTASIRVRVATGFLSAYSANISTISGRGSKRRKLAYSIPTALGQQLIDTFCETILSKLRTAFRPDGADNHGIWYLDEFDPPFEGLTLLEYHGVDAATIALPTWVTKATEVTDRLDNERLAKVAFGLAGVTPPNLMAVIESLENKVKVVVLTGAPCSGKSTAIKELSAEFARDVLFVPEVATMLMGTIGIKPTLIGGNRFQQLVHAVQLQLESAAIIQAARSGQCLVVVDRGAIDGAAYTTIPEFQAMFGSITSHYARYVSVLYCAAAPEAIFEAQRDNNPNRLETYQQALAAGAKIEAIYKSHPHFHTIDGGSWPEKVGRLRGYLCHLLAPI